MNGKKLIVIKPNGNHSNRLLQNLHFEVFCREHQIEYRNPTFRDMADYYVEPCNAETNLFFKILQIDFLGKLFPHSRVVKRIFSVVWLLSKLGCLKLIRFDNKNKESEYGNVLLKAFEKNDVVYVVGWKFRLPQLAEKHQEEMARKYRLKQCFYKNNPFVNKINELKQQGCTLIGTHIRKGDYKKWKGGMYYFDDSVYEENMKNISKHLLQQGKDKQIFILFSNEPLEFQESANTMISKENWYIDQYIMSVCDYLIGPPSTFTLWANYVGSVKLFYIYDKNNRHYIN